MNAYLSFLCTLTVALFTGGCARSHQSAATLVKPLDDSIPKAIAELTSALAENDTERFSRLFLYPLERPYPLKAIRDASEMKKYFPQLVDDSLKKVITGPNSLEWHQYGWRGWSLDEGQYVWIDSLIYDIPYLSKAETRELLRLRDAEMASLPADMRQGWEPVITLRAPNTGEIFRIDRRKQPEHASSRAYTGVPTDYRLSIYKSGESLAGHPADILDGKMTAEGSMQIRTYTFQSPAGIDIIYKQDIPDDNAQTLSIRRNGSDSAELTVVPVYWLDLTGK